MKALILSIAAVVLLVGCNNTAQLVDCIDGCTHSKDGSDGANGNNGTNGHNSRIVVSNIPIGPATLCTAQNGGYFYESYLDLDDDGVLDSLEATLPSYSGTAVCNGSNGTNAPPTQFSVMEVIDPCGRQGSASSPDELFQRMANGMLVVSFSKNTGGTMTRLSNIVPSEDGTFSGGTTDDTGCSVSITRSGNNVTLTSSPLGPIGVWNWTTSY